jgi:hypothetical protein
LQVFQAEVVTEYAGLGHRLCEAGCQAKIAECSQDEERSRDAAANQLYTFLNRFYAERKQIRERMLQWRKDCINAGWYDMPLFAPIGSQYGTGDAAISAVYRTEADLSTENVDGFLFVADIFDPGLHGPSAGVGGDSIGLATSCLEGAGRGFGLPFNQLTVKYPDLETYGGPGQRPVPRPYYLRIPFRTPRILEGIASGAARTERP